MNNSLSSYELALVTDRDILLTKNRIIQKVSQLFGELAVTYQELLANSALYDEMPVNAKVSRGENYKGLPYVMLDFPRQFSKENTFAIRSFFWWGNFFSITLHLSGEYQHQYIPSIQNAIDLKLFDQWYLSSGTTAWEHNFEEDNYKQIAGQPMDLMDRPFIKIAKKIPLTQWDESQKFFIENFDFLIKVLKS